MPAGVKGHLITDFERHYITPYIFFFNGITSGLKSGRLHTKAGTADMIIKNENHKVLKPWKGDMILLSVADSRLMVDGSWLNLKL